jgi:hypothetical protein
VSFVVIKKSNQCKAIRYLYESRQPSAVSTQQKAFIFCCARHQGMGVYMKVLSFKC